MRVWVTRSEPGARRLVEALTARGIDAQAVPAIEIADMPPKLYAMGGEGQLQPQADDVSVEPDICIVVSQHAAARYRASPWFFPGARHIAIGHATQRVLDHPAELAPEATTEGLLASPALQGADLSVMIISGKGGRADLAEALKSRGQRVFKLELYERRRGDLAALNPREGDIIEVGSGFGLEQVGRHIAGSEAGLDKLFLIVPSRRVYETARAMKFYNSRIAKSAEIADVVDAIVALRE